MVIRIGKYIYLLDEISLRLPKQKTHFKVLRFRITLCPQHWFVCPPNFVEVTMVIVWPTFHSSVSAVEIVQWCTSSSDYLELSSDVVSKWFQVHDNSWVSLGVKETICPIKRNLAIEKKIFFIPSMWNFSFDVLTYFHLPILPWIPRGS